MVEPNRKPATIERWAEREWWDTKPWRKRQVRTSPSPPDKIQAYAAISPTCAWVVYLVSVGTWQRSESSQACPSR